MDNKGHDRYKQPSVIVALNIMPPELLRVWTPLDFSLIVTKLNAYGSRSEIGVTRSGCQYAVVL